MCPHDVLRIEQCLNYSSQDASRPEARTRWRDAYLITEYRLDAATGLILNLASGDSRLCLTDIFAAQSSEHLVRQWWYTGWETRCKTSDSKLANRDLWRSAASHSRAKSTRHQHRSITASQHLAVHRRRLQIQIQIQYHDEMWHEGMKSKKVNLDASLFGLHILLPHSVGYL